MRALAAQARNPYARRWLWIPGSLAKNSRPGMTELERFNPIQNVLEHDPESGFRFPKRSCENKRSAAGLIQHNEPHPPHRCVMRSSTYKGSGRNTSMPASNP
jgi:hypothetical protein